MIDVDSGSVRWITRFPAWHARPTRRAALRLRHHVPDRGLHVYAVDDDGEPARLCPSEASNQGAHWGHPFPYNDGPVAVEAAQHTHPHPRFARRFAGAVHPDRSGHAQLYEVMLEDRQ